MEFPFRLRCLYILSYTGNGHFLLTRKLNFAFFPFSSGCSKRGPGILGSSNRTSLAEGHQINSRNPRTRVEIV